MPEQTTHMTMFIYSASSELSYYQVVTNSVNKKQLEDLGFVDHIDKVRAPAKTRNKVAKNA